MTKRFLTLAFALLLLATPAFAVGTVTQALSRLPNDIVLLQFDWTGDIKDGTVPNTDTSAYNTTYLKGWCLYLVSTTPGSPAPTAYSVTLTNSGSVDLMVGAAASRSTTVSEDVFPFALATRLVDSTLTLHVSGNSTASAKGTVKCYFVKFPVPLAPSIGGTMATSGTINGIASNGVTDVTGIAADAASAFYVGFVSISSSDYSNGWKLTLCDGDCSTATHKLVLPVPRSTASGDFSGLVTPINPMFPVTRGNALKFVCSGACGTAITLSGTYLKLPN